jgi:diguanylate cyclase (GGDEF)-like protein
VSGTDGGRLMTSGCIVAVATLVVLVGALAHQLAHARAIAMRDPLTETLNRRGWRRALAAADRRRAARPIADVVADVRGLAAANRAGGHERGDALLTTAAAALERACEPGSRIARLGGDEFGVLLARAEQALPCDEQARRLEAALKEAGTPAYIGVADVRPGEPLTATWRRADAAAVAAKNKTTDQEHHGR